MPYYVIQKGTHKPEDKPVNTGHIHPRDIVTSLTKQVRQASIESRRPHLNTYN